MKGFLNDISITFEFEPQKLTTFSSSIPLGSHVTRLTIPSFTFKKSSLKNRFEFDLYSKNDYILYIPEKRIKYFLYGVLFKSYEIQSKLSINEEVIEYTIEIDYFETEIVTSLYLSDYL